MDEDIVGFYNDIYRDKPDKWDVDWKDAQTFYYLSEHTDEPKTLWDIGCGNGHTIEYFSKKWPNTHYYGIDISDEAIRLASERVPEAVFLCDNIENIEKPIPYADVVIIMGVAEHFEDLIPSLRNLKKYGKLIYLEVPDCLLAAHSWGSTNKEEGFRETYTGAENPTNQKEWHLRQSTWEEKIRFAGLEIVQFIPGTYARFLWILK